MTHEVDTLTGQTFTCNSRLCSRSLLSFPTHRTYSGSHRRVTSLDSEAHGRYTSAVEIAFLTAYGLATPCRQEHIDVIAGLVEPHLMHYCIELPLALEALMHEFMNSESVGNLLTLK